MSGVAASPGAPDQSEQGYILVFVLLLMTFIGLGAGPVFDAANLNRDATLTVQAAENGSYAADGGMEYAIQKLRGLSCAPLPSVTVPSTLDGPGGQAISLIVVTCMSAGSINTYTLTSSVPTGLNETASTTKAQVAINTGSLAKEVSIQYWSSVQS